MPMNVGKSREAREAALRQISRGDFRTEQWGPGGAWVLFQRGHVVHSLFRARPATSGTFRFGYKLTELREFQHELWVCGTDGEYVLLPHALLLDLARAPGAYTDPRRPDYHQADIDLRTGEIVYAAQGQRRNIRHFCGALLD